MSWSAFSHTNTEGSKIEYFIINTVVIGKQIGRILVVVNSCCWIFAGTRIPWRKCKWWQHRECVWMNHKTCSTFVHSANIHSAYSKYQVPFWTLGNDCWATQAGSQLSRSQHCGGEDKNTQWNNCKLSEQGTKMRWWDRELDGDLVWVGRKPSSGGGLSQLRPHVGSRYKT